MGKFVDEAVSAYCGCVNSPSPEIGVSAIGLRTIRIGRPITPEEVADLIDE